MTITLYAIKTLVLKTSFLLMNFKKIHYNVHTGPQREIFPGGTKIDAGPPKFSEALTDQSKKVFTQIWFHFLPKIK